MAEETRVPVEYYQPVASLVQTLSPILLSSTPQVEKQNPQKIHHKYLVSDEDSSEPLVIWPCHILSGNLENPGKTQFGHIFFIRLTIFQIPCKAYFGHVSLKSF